jgi:hypothetical protein
MTLFMALGYTLGGWAARCWRSSRPRRWNLLPSERGQDPF